MKCVEFWLQLPLLLALLGGWMPEAMAAYYTATVDGIKWNYTVSGGEASVGGEASWNSVVTAVPTNTSGSIVIPAKLGGYPVTRIGDYAFFWCGGLTDVAVPDSVTGIGTNALGWCVGLTVVAVPDRVTGIGKNVIYGCEGLKTLYVPATWKSKYVHDEETGKNVLWSEYAAVPAGSERTFTADAASGKLLGVTANVPWTAKSSASWLTVKTASGSGSGKIEYAVAANTGAGSRAGIISVTGGGLTRTFTVTQRGAKAETQESPVAVPCQWLEDNAAGILAANGGDYEATATAPAENGHPVWECYAAALSTSDATEEFKVKGISFVDGEAVVEWEPDLNANGTMSNRTYRVEGKTTPTNEWAPADANSRFFRVWVGMPLH